MNKIDSAACVLVLHEPGPGGLEAVRRAARLVARLFVVDNSRPSVRLDGMPGNVRRIRNGTNLGVARALNQGMLAARDQGFAYALLLDQDSVIERHSVERLLTAHAALDDAFIVCPRVLYEPDAAQPPRKARGAVTRVNVAISSGSLVDLSRLDEVGLHDEKLFVDYVDFEYCLRAATRGCFTYRVEDAVMHHWLGDQRAARFLGIRCHPTRHSPERRYYKTRNMLYVWRKYFRTHPRWVMRSARKLVVEILEIWLFEDRKVEKSLACFEGLGDFLVGRYGERGARGSIDRRPSLQAKLE